MTEPKYTPGRFVWHEMGTPDVDKSKKFYGALFGWSFNEVPMPNGAYTMIVQGEKMLGGMMDLANIGKDGVPPHWMGFVSVPNVDESAAAAKSAGGTIGMEPTDIPNVGRFAVIGDPQHAYSTAFKSNSGDPAPAEKPEPGTFCWDQLNTTDVDAAKAFYQKVYGWSPVEWNGFQTFNAGDVGVASVMPVQGGAPPHWLCYVIVEDLAKARETTKSSGGNVIVEEIPIPEVGTIAVIQDDVGAMLGIMQP